VLRASCLQQLYYCTENRLVKKSTTLKQPEQIQKGVAANQNPLLSQLTLKTTSLKRQPSHKTTSQDSHKTQAK